MYDKSNIKERGENEVKTYLRVLETVEASGVNAWLVGDPVRDVVMGIQPMTLSVVVEPCDLKALAASLGDGTIMGPEAFPVLHTSILGAKVEISCMKGNMIEEDLAKRDFSINAIAIRSDDSFVDPFYGRHDIRNSLIRLSGDDIELVKNDPIRIVRMLRFASELKMNIFWKSEADVRAFIARSPEQIKNTPTERWGREVLVGMGRYPYDFIYLCDRYRLLSLFVNELEELKEIQLEGGGSLFDHTLDSLRIAQNFLVTRKRRENDIAFSLAMLFHHAGAEGGHPTDTTKAAEIAARYLRRWNVNTGTIDIVAAVIKNYHSLFKARTEERLCEWVLKYGYEAVEMTLDFAICNSQADKMRNMEALAANRWRLAEVGRRFDEAGRKTNGTRRYLTGDEVMKTLDIKPGKVVGEILNELGMAVGTGIVNSRREATAWILKRGAGSGE